MSDSKNEKNKEGRPEKAAPHKLSTQSQGLDDRLVPIVVIHTKVLEQTTSLTNQHQQSTTGVVIFVVSPKVLGEVLDSLSEKGDLNLWGSGVAFETRIGRDEFSLALCCHGHGISP